MEKIYAHCVKCGKAKNDGPECQHCGVIYAKAEKALNFSVDSINGEADSYYKEDDEQQETKTETIRLSCKVCSNILSPQAQVCPNCGEPTPLKNKIVLTSFTIVALMIGFIFFSTKSCTDSFFPESTAQINTPKPAKTPAQIHQEAINRCFIGGEHQRVAYLIQRFLNDPDSYRHDETTYTEHGDHLLVTTHFRGTNAFGGVVRNSIVVKTGIYDCSLLDIVTPPK